MTARTLRRRADWARVRSWRGNVRVAQLTLTAAPPANHDVLESFLEALRADGYTEVLTNAVTPADALPFVDVGFAVRERLHLLAHDLHDLPEASRSTRKARHRDHQAVLALDATAFDDAWRLDEQGLSDTVGATPITRFRVAPSDAVVGNIGAYAISGRAGVHGYVQRVAVHRDLRRGGWGRAIVGDALRWLARHGAQRALVNTQLDNSGALQLYLACGFTELPLGLSVLGRSL